YKISGFFNEPLLYTGVGAVRREFLDKYYKYKIVQLYTHASEAAHEGDPVIYFADSAVRLSELMAVDHPATRLIILSACETGKGKWNEGEGVFSFNRAFAELGVPSAMVNLWSVDNQSTYRLNEIFCKYLSEGVASDVALQLAKIDFMHSADKEHRLPYYWAASVIAGRVITLDKSARTWDMGYWAVLSVFFVAAFLVISYVRMRFIF
ncbi:MAG: CHAT domain-containing protein, partial [Chitinophagaceae bacterium]